MTDDRPSWTRCGPLQEIDYILRYKLTDLSDGEQLRA